ncbi:MULTISPECIES: hypothetical protein [unclassified Sphingobacterium]|uniref:hypothetical protein n=1 Tax=unclassified Sphingobacterium TaxID=2609468 RepID=UPI00104A4523|nr:MULTISPECIES: hypothetical protein [unclassified Sphingobacterium]MCS3557664.1 hypothetical protein [Sphingobacterium sp. JUb21]TCQ95045.1 hypothetical protein EDF66_1324 [Sphingobacterium sp. JUb20]
MALFQLNNQDEPTNPSSYTLASGTPSCSGDQQICTIEATNSGGQPVIDTNLLKQMVRALNRHTNEPLVKLQG